MDRIIRKTSRFVTYFFFELTYVVTYVRENGFYITHKSIRKVERLCLKYLLAQN